MDPNKTLNMTMLCDFYELTMGNGYLEHGMQDRITYFDVFFRSVPDDGGYAIAAGLEQIIDYIENLHFTDEDIAYLRSRKLFSEAFLDYLKNFRFTGDIWADRHKGQPHLPRGERTHGARVRLPPRTGRRRGDPRRARSLHRRLRRHRLHDLGRGVRRVRRRHDGALLGADVRLRARRLPRLL